MDQSSGSPVLHSVYVQWRDTEETATLSEVKMEEKAFGFPFFALPNSRFLEFRHLSSLVFVLGPCTKKKILYIFNTYKTQHIVLQLLNINI